MQSSSSVSQTLGGQEFNLEVSGFSNQSGLDLVLTLDPSLLICPNCAKDKDKISNKKPTAPTTKCPDCAKVQELLESQADNVLDLTGDFLEQLKKTKLKLIEAEKAASRYLDNAEKDKFYEVCLILPPGPNKSKSNATTGFPSLYRSESSLYINSDWDEEEDCASSVLSSSETVKEDIPVPGTPDSAFYGSQYSRTDSATSPISPYNNNNKVHTNEQTIYCFQPHEPDASVDLGDLKYLSRELSGENTALADELGDTQAKITDLRKIANLLKLSLQGELKPDPFDIRDGAGGGINCDSCAASGHIHCIPKHRLRQQMRIVLNNFEKTILEMLENNKHLFDKMKIKYRDEVEANPELAFVSYKHVWSLFTKLSETMRGITTSVLYLVSRALEDWMLFSWGFIAWAWPTLVLISNRLLEKLYPRVSAIKAFVSSEPFCAFAKKWNEGQSLGTCFKELETEAFLSTVCRISVSFVSIYMSLPDYAGQ